jgi:hypothetical protein
MEKTQTSNKKINRLIIKPTYKRVLTIVTPKMLLRMIKMIRKLQDPKLKLDKAMTGFHLKIH